MEFNQIFLVHEVEFLKNWKIRKKSWTKNLNCNFENFPVEIEKIDENEFCRIQNSLSLCTFQNFKIPTINGWKMGLKIGVWKINLFSGSKSVIRKKVIIFLKIRFQYRIELTKIYSPSTKTTVKSSIFKKLQRFKK